MRIIKSAYLQQLPAVQISPDYDGGTDEGMAEMNAWLLKMFGKKDRALVIGDTVFVSHEAYNKMLALV